MEAPTFVLRTSGYNFVLPETKFILIPISLDVRSIFLRTKQHTVHLLITMLAYKIEKYLRNAWADYDLTVEEGILKLNRITSKLNNIRRQHDIQRSSS